MLLNRDGYWLMATDPKDEWGFMLPHGNSFAKRYPDIWDQMVEGRGNGVVENLEGIFVYDRINPLVARQHYSSATASHTHDDADSISMLVAEHYDWIAVSFFSTEHRMQVIHKYIGQAVVIWLLLAVLMLLLGIPLAMARIKQRQLDQQLLMQQQE